jgi:hypothetical protein
VGDAQVDDSELARAREAVGRWDALPFRLGDRPRSFVLTETVREVGFRTGWAKIAMLGGRIARAAEVEVPDAVLTALSPRYRGAGDPVTALAAEMDLSHGRVLQITGARRGLAAFATDRGSRTFAAWFVEIEDAPGAAVVLDPDVECHSVTGLSGVCVVRVADSGVVDDGVEQVARVGTGPVARVEPDGRTLKVQFVGSPEIYTDYPSAHAVEGGNAVAVVPIAVERTDPMAARLAYGQVREVTVVLTEPLGDRVIIDWRTGYPMSR